MSTDLFTVHPDDLVRLVANMMDWRDISHVPVEDDDGRLVGLVSHRHMVRLLAANRPNLIPKACWSATSCRPFRADHSRGLA